MQRSRSRLTLAATAVLATLGVVACSSDDDSGSESDGDTSISVTIPDVSIPDITIPDVTIGDVTIPDVSLPEGVTIPEVGALDEQCQEYYRLFSSAFAGDTDSIGALDDAMSDLREQVPEDLGDDVDVVSTALDTLVELSEENPGNPAALYSDPDAIALFTDPEFTQASQELSTWLATECTAG